MSRPHVKTIIYQRYPSRPDLEIQRASTTTTPSGTHIYRSTSRLSRSQSPSSSNSIHSPLPDHKILRTNNEEISKYLILLKDQRDELTMLIEKQESEKKQLKTEIARLRYKFKLVAKSLNQRIMTYERYDQTIKEAETLFKKIVVSSDTLLGAVRKDAGVLEETINKKVGTEVSKLPPKKTGSQSRSQVKISKIPQISQASLFQQRTLNQATEERASQLHSTLDIAFQPELDKTNTDKQQQSDQQPNLTAQPSPAKQPKEEPQKEELGGKLPTGSYPKLSLFGLGRVDSIDYI